MLKTFLLSRPYAVFDASNKEHRQAYNNFVKNKSWDGCPYRFVTEETYTDLISNINHRIVEYYLQQEFKKPVARKRK